MDKNLKALFDACSSPRDLKEEAYDSFNEETFGNSMETWEQSESFDPTSTLNKATSDVPEPDNGSASVKEKTTIGGPEKTAGSCSNRSEVDDNDQEKDNMLYLIDSTLSHLGLGLTRQRQDNGGEVKKTFGNSQRVNETQEEGMTEALDTVRSNPEENEWTLSKQKLEEGYREPMSCTLQRSELEVEDKSLSRREPFHSITLDRGDADRVVIGASGPMMSHRRGSGRFESTRFERGNGHPCRTFSSQDVAAHGAATTSGQGGSAPIKPENFDLRNVETFGIDAVQKHIQDHNPGNSISNSNNNTGSTSSNNNNNNNSNSGSSNGPSCHYANGPNGTAHSGLTSSSASGLRSLRNGSRYDDDGSNANSGGFGNDRNGTRARLPEIRDPRMYDFYMELWQRMHQEAAAEEHNAAANNSGNMPNQLSNNSNNHGSKSVATYNSSSIISESRSNGGPRRPSDQRPGDTQFEAQMTELKHKVWEQLELAAELGPSIGVMEDVVDRLVDPTEPPSAEDRLKALRKLANSVTPDNVCNLVRLVHSRRLLMYTLAHLWSETSLRDHALELVSTMLRRLDTLLVSDGSDMVFGQKREVFTRIFSGCTMEQLTCLTACLLKAPAMAVESKLGLFFIGRILECADDAELSCMPSLWVDKCLPKITQHVASVKRADLVQELVGTRALSHIIKNMDSVGIMRAVHAANAQSANSTSY